MGGCGVGRVTMDAVAAQARVGKGTVFRRFGSREGLMASLLDHSRGPVAVPSSGPPPPGRAPTRTADRVRPSRMPCT